MKRFLLLTIFLVSNLSFSQIEKLKGNWISEDNEMISIVENPNEKNSLTSKISNDDFYLKIISDTLSFQSKYFTSSDNYKKMITDKYDLKIIELSDSLLIVKPVSKFSKKFFNSEKIIIFKNQKYITDKSFKFEKLVFYKSECFNYCPEINFMIDSHRNIKINAIYFLEPYLINIDKEKSGNFIGKLDNETYNQLIDKLIKAKIGTINITDDPLCCDGTIKRIIVYHNGKRNYIETMFAPRILRELILYLSDLTNQIKLTRTEDKFEFEK
jgi:hypothetical protein